MGARIKDLWHQVDFLKSRLWNLEAQDDWKLLTIVTGFNELYAATPVDDMDFAAGQALLDSEFRDAVRRLLNALHANFDRLFVNIIALPEHLYFHGNSPSCNFVRWFEGVKDEKINVRRVAKRWNRIWAEEIELGKKQKWSDTFHVVLQPIVEGMWWSAAAWDTVSCYHISRKIHKQLAISLWNAMLSLPDEKATFLNMTGVPKCPQGFQRLQ
eukprot:gnl/TRDRNA2_/TRDRNA2_89130_c0_seq3.p1 gnl/TRDRNA2_/TRDRNA2_89130_c0~~gnl/TRDRNA2_/TRDRNA2_89130_c0_seq3.p1  ORF type:complete len:213 (-),score=33.29 gnl/TRDRNA2_/TRDRNA2_89130_c0_seq3:326-964(-)